MLSDYDGPELKVYENTPEACNTATGVVTLPSFSAGPVEELSFREYLAKRAKEDAERMALYACSCSLAAIVELLEAGFTPSILLEQAKERLQEAATETGNDFFTRFERV